LKKLLIVGAFPKDNSKVFGGVVTACRTLKESAIKDHFDLILIDSTQISNPAPNFIIRAFLSFFKFYRYLTKLLSTRPDAIILFTSLGLSVLEKGLMAWMARFRRIPILIFPRGGALIDNVKRSRFEYFWVKLAMKGATHILCQGPAWQRFSTNILGFKNDNSPIVFNWAATQSLLAIGNMRSEPSKNKFPTLLFLGWLEEDKGIFDLLDACLSLTEIYKFSIIIAGRGNVEGKVHSFVNANELNRIVEFVGWVDGEEKESLLKKADILVLPSWAEGFPNAVIEAMAAKLAVVVSKVGAIPDLISDNDQALVIPPKDSKSLACAIERLITDNEFRVALAERGFLFANENFSESKCITRLISVIDYAIDEASDKRK